jgi:hypothetical protein
MGLLTSVLDAMRPPSPRCGLWSYLGVCTASSGSQGFYRRFRLQFLWCLWIVPDLQPPVLSTVPGRENHRKHVTGALPKLSLPQGRNTDVVLPQVLGTSASRVVISTAPHLQTSGSSRGGSRRTKNGNEHAEKLSLLLVTKTAVVRLPTRVTLFLVMLRLTLIFSLQTSDRNRLDDRWPLSPA